MAATDKKTQQFVTLHIGEPVATSGLGASLVNDDEKVALMASAALRGDVQLLNSYVLRGWSVKTAGADGRTALHVVAKEGRVEPAKALIEFGADVQAKDKNGQTPVEVAKAAGHSVLAEWLQGNAGMASFEIETKKAAKKRQQNWKLAGWFGCFEIAIIILFIIFVRYSPDADASQSAAAGQEVVNSIYPFFQDIHVMTYVGFGFLMVFARRNMYGAVGITFLIAAFATQWFLLVDGFWANVFNHDMIGREDGPAGWHKVLLNIKYLVRADFCAVACLISYGALLGKVSHLQMMVVIVFEVVGYSLNEQIGMVLKITDLGGSMVIHMFGAFFGLGATYFLSTKKAIANAETASVYHSDVIAMVGTLFLWLYWPSFNSALGAGNTQHRAIINTYCSLAASCVMAFLVSSLCRPNYKLNMTDIQNATLAGGVAMGTCADLLINPGPALVIGAAAGVISTLGFIYMTPWLERTLSIHDTCGINNLHGMPSILGAIAGMIAAGDAGDNYGEQLGHIFPKMPNGRSAGNQAGLQIAFCAISIGIGLGSGIIAGIIARYRYFDPLEDEELFLDSAQWEVPTENTPSDVEQGLVAANKETQERVQKLESRINVDGAELNKLGSVFDNLLSRLGKKDA